LGFGSPVERTRSRKLPRFSRPRSPRNGNASAQPVLGAGTALRRRQPPPFCADRTALHAVRRRYVYLVARPLVHLRRAHALPHPADLLGHARPHPNVVRLIVARSVPRREDRRELVEGELAVRSRIAPGTTARDQLLIGVAFRGPVSRRKVT